MDKKFYHIIERDEKDDSGAIVVDLELGGEHITTGTPISIRDIVRARIKAGDKYSVRETYEGENSKGESPLPVNMTAAEFIAMWERWRNFK
jgi:hypothetical protein